MTNKLFCETHLLWIHVILGMLAERRFQVSCQGHLLFCCLFPQLLDLVSGEIPTPTVTTCFAWSWPSSHESWGRSLFWSQGLVQKWEQGSSQGPIRDTTPPTPAPPGVCLNNSKDVVSSSHWTWPWEVLRARLQLGRKLVSEDKAVTWRRAELSREMWRSWAPWLCLNSYIQLCLKPSFFTDYLCSWANKFYLCLLVWASFLSWNQGTPPFPTDSWSWLYQV